LQKNRMWNLLVGIGVVHHRSYWIGIVRGNTEAQKGYGSCMLPRYVPPTTFQAQYCSSKQSSW
jgi:hypothetical protein